MNRPMLIGIVAGAAIATAGGVIAGYNALRDDAPVAVAAAPAVDCYDEVVTHQADPKDEHRIAGSVIGGLVGGAVGKDVGDRDLTTAAGAAVGAIAGNQAQKAFQERKDYTTTETRCDPAR